MSNLILQRESGRQRPKNFDIEKPAACNLPPLQIRARWKQAGKIPIIEQAQRRRGPQDQPICRET
jgi:hypothetical protein